MLDAIQQYLHRRRGGIVKSATFLCGSYVVSAYVSERLDEMKDKMLRNKLARDSLRRRFQSTHDDACFTIMALIPTLASQVLEDMDVEALTNELQSISRASRSRTLQPPPNQPRSQSIPEISSVSDVHSDPDSLSFSSCSVPGLDGDRTSSSLSHNMESSITSTSSRTKGQLWNEVKILALTRTLTTLYTITLLSLLTAVQLNLLGRSRYVDSVRASDRAERARDEVPDFSLTGILAREAMAKIADVEAIWPAWMLGENEDEEEEDVLDAIPEQTELRFLTLSWWVLHVGWKDVATRVRSSVESVFDEVSLKSKLSSSELFALILDVRRRVETDGAGGNMGTRFLSTLLPPTPETTAHVLAQGGALSIPQESKTRDSIDRSSIHGNHHSEKSYDGLSHATAIQIESPVPRPATFFTPPSSHAYESDLSSRPSPSSSTSPARCVHTALPEGTFKSPSTSRATLDLDPQFNALLAQTHRYLSGPDFAYALCCALDRATEVLMDGLRARVFVDTASAVNPPNFEGAQGQLRTGDDAGQLKEEIRVRLAGMLPGLARWSQLALNATPNELVDNIMAVREVNALEAIIISDYDGRFPSIP